MKHEFVPPPRDWPWVPPEVARELLCCTDEALKQKRKAKQITCTQFTKPGGKYYYDYYQMKEQMERNKQPAVC
jgi:hypothetical protein